MPKEHKKRGRRAEEKKRKHKPGELIEEELEAKRQRHAQDDDVHMDDAPMDDAPMDDAPMGEGHEGQQHLGAFPHPDETPFYGMLDEEEQEYFRRADDLLELNQFNDADDRSNFLASIYKEAEGKELKMANSQSCSRLMERLIKLSSPLQLKTLFQKFSAK
jgi:nucleolar protein 9